MFLDVPISIFNTCVFACLISFLVPHQTVQLGHGALASWLADVPHLDAALSSGVDVACRGADGDGAHHLSVVQAVNLTGVSWDTWAQQGVRRKGHRLHLAVCAHVERVGTVEDRERERRGQKDFRAEQPELKIKSLDEQELQRKLKD